MKKVLTLIALLMVMQLLIGAVAANAAPVAQGTCPVGGCPGYGPGYWGGPAPYPALYGQGFQPISYPVTYYSTSSCYQYYTYCSYPLYHHYQPVYYWWDYPYFNSCYGAPPAPVCNPCW